MISSRYAPIVALLLVLPLIPTIIHSYLELKTDDGKSVAQIDLVLNNFTSQPTSRNPGWGMDVFGTEDWIERVYTDKQGHKVQLFAARSYDHKRLYHHPELAVSYGRDLRREKNVVLTGTRDIPVNLLRNSNGYGFVAYAFLYDGKFIDDPIIHQLMDSLNLLVSARNPITLFYVSDTDTAPSAAFNSTNAAMILSEAIDSFENNSSSKLED
ncbi:MAG: hypothetical protein M8364_10685 [Methylobacter sp.]|uniref:hypothetical protein n=1 Tax=Methylobacter sp. TaxID=2051955 RepID=UPI002587AEC8|nr:hypothetical protein [Methylobacter sp.]MCL7421355.1 hypothetical protein [Methylobacter sp.]